MSRTWGIARGQTSAAPPPTFKASGIEGNTAPTGYAAGASEAYSRKVATLVPLLQEADLLRLLPGAKEETCLGEPELVLAASRSPGGFEPNVRLGRFYLQQANPSLAMRPLAVALQRQPDDPQTLLYVAIAELQTKNYAGAAATIHQLLRRNERDANAHKLSGALDAALGHSSEAVREFNVAGELDPSAANLYSAALAELAYGPVEVAEAAFDSATKRHPESFELWLGRGVAALLAGHKSDAGASLWRATSGARTSRLAFTLLAMQDGGDAVVSRDLLQELQHLSTQRSEDAMQDAILHYDYAVALSKTADPSGHSLELQREQLELAVKEEPKFAAAHFQLGLLEAEHANASAAAAELARAIALDDEVPEWHYRLSRAYRRLNLVSAAEEEFHRFEELKAAHPQGTAGDELLEGMPLRSLIAASEPCSVPSR